MACTLIWSQFPATIFKISFVVRLISHADMLQEQPEIGRMVPERRLHHIREIIFSPYRLVYRVDHEHERFEIARVWHATRGKPETSSA